MGVHTPPRGRLPTPLSAAVPRGNCSTRRANFFFPPLHLSSPLDEISMRRIVHVVLLVVLQSLWDWTRGWSLAQPAAYAPTAPWLALGMTLLLWQIMVWCTVALFGLLDGALAGRRFCCATRRCLAQRCGVRGKLELDDGKLEPPFCRQLPVAVSNMVMVNVVVITVFAALQRWSPGWFVAEPPRATFVARLGWSFVYTARHFLTADLFFYAGHWAMHRVPALQKLHRLHHSSSASCAIAGYYMSPLDFALEHGPIFISWTLWRTVGASWPISVVVGTWNLLATHSGWDLAWGPDPRDHWLHHNGGRRGVESNLGIFLDHLFGTKVKMPVAGALSARCRPLYI